MYINKIIRHALFTPVINSVEVENENEYINVSPCLDTRLSSFDGDVCVIENITAVNNNWPTNIILHVNLIGVPIDSPTVIQRFDDNRPKGTFPVYSPKSAYDNTGSELIRLGSHRAIEVTYSGSGSALFLDSEKRQEISIIAGQIANDLGKVLIPENNVVYEKPFAFQTAESLVEKWQKAKSAWVLESPKYTGGDSAPIIVSLHALGGAWQDGLNPMDMEQVYFQIGNNGGRTIVHPTKAKYWETNGIKPSAEFNNFQGSGIICLENISVEQSLSLAQAISQGFAKISLTTAQATETVMYKSSQILRSAIDAKTFDLYFSRMEEI